MYLGGIMTQDIDKKTIEQAKSCKFSQTCLKKFDSSLCCDILEEGKDCLMVKPVSTFKSENCSFCQEIKKDKNNVHICTCPIRIELYRQLEK